MLQWDHGFLDRNRQDGAEVGKVGSIRPDLLSGPLARKAVLQVLRRIKIEFRNAIAEGPGWMSIGHFGEVGMVCSVDEMGLEVFSKFLAPDIN